MTVTTKQGHLQERGTQNPFAPKTLDTLVKDSARNQALSASLLALVERNALGFPPFVTTEAHPVGQQVFYDRKLWEFTSALAQGAAWDSTKVREFSIKEYCDALINALQDGLESGSVIPALAGNLEAWEDNSVPVENNFDTTIRTTAGDDPINSDDGGIVKSIVPITDFKCTGLLATAENQ